MPLDKNTGDAGYIGLELLEFENKSQEILRKCFTVEKSVNEGYFKLDKALDVYGIKREDFINYLLGNLIQEVRQPANKIESTEDDAKKLLNIISYLAFIYSTQMNFMSKDLRNKFNELIHIGSTDK